MNRPPPWWSNLSTPQRWLVLGGLKVVLLVLAVYTVLHLKGLV